MADIFLSYARDDVSRARLLAQALESQGWSVWWDRRIPHGKDFNVYIEQQLEMARCIVVLWSKASIGSQFVRDEAAEGRNGRLVPALIDQVKQPLGFRQLQAADLTDWSGQPSHDEFQWLVGSITSIVAPRPTTAVQNAPPPDLRGDVRTDSAGRLGDRPSPDAVLTEASNQATTPPSPARRRGSAALGIVVVFLTVLWLLGMVSGYTLGNFIWILLIIAVVLYIVGWIARR
jgi:hypothetical protein